MVPWQIRASSVGRYRHRLVALHFAIVKIGPVDGGNHHFLVLARKQPAPPDGGDLRACGGEKLRW